MNHRADEVLSRIVPALQQTFEDGLRAAVVTGSVIRGDFVSFYSDLDVHAFLEPASLRIILRLVSPDSSATSRTRAASTPSSGLTVPAGTCRPASGLARLINVSSSTQPLRTRVM